MSSRGLKTRPEREAHRKAFPSHLYNYLPASEAAATAPHEKPCEQAAFCG